MERGFGLWVKQELEQTRLVITELITLDNLESFSEQELETLGIAKEEFRDTAEKQIAVLTRLRAFANMERLDQTKLCAMSDEDLHTIRNEIKKIDRSITDIEAIKLMSAEAKALKMAIDKLQLSRYKLDVDDCISERNQARGASIHEHNK